jgi:hypothetical protein
MSAGNYQVDAFSERAPAGKQSVPTAVTVVGLLAITNAGLLLAHAVVRVAELDASGALAAGPAGWHSGLVPTATGRLALDALYYFFAGAGLAASTVAFVRLRRWSWIVLMSWCVLMLLVNLGRAVNGSADWVSMLLFSVTVLLLNIEEVQRAYDLRQAHAPRPVRYAKPSRQRD